MYSNSIILTGCHFESFPGGPPPTEIGRRLTVVGYSVDELKLAPFPGIKTHESSLSWHAAAALAAYLRNRQQHRQRQTTSATDILVCHVFIHGAGPYTSVNLGLCLLKLSGARVGLYFSIDAPPSAFDRLFLTLPVAPPAKRPQSRKLLIVHVSWRRLQQTIFTG